MKKFQALVCVFALVGAVSASAEEHGHGHTAAPAAAAATAGTKTETAPAADHAKKDKKVSKKNCAKMKDKPEKAKCMEETAKM